MIFLFFLVYVWKGFFVCEKERLVYYDKGIKFEIEGLEIGLEEILIVIMEVER